MMITLMNSLGVVLALALLFAFVWGAWSHTVEQTLGCSHLTDLSSGTKIKRYFTLLGKVLWNIAVLIVMVGAILLEFISLKGNEDGKQETKIDSNGNYWYRTKGGSWYTFSPDEDASEPWY